MTRQTKRENKKAAKPHTRKLRATATIIGILIAIGTLYLNYAYSGAEALRTGVYQPLYSEIERVEFALRANTVEQPLETKMFASLRQTGVLSRVPKSLKKKLSTFYEHAGQVNGLIAPVSEKLLRETSRRIRDLRTERSDRAWLESAKRIIEQQENAKPGSSDIVTFTMHHAGRSRGWDFRDPTNPRIITPGGPTWQINDWMAFPQSLATIEPLFTDLDYLYFNDVHDTWFYRITRDDLKRHNLQLRDFLQGVHSALNQDENFQMLVRNEPWALADAEVLKSELSERIAHPKRLRDLLE